MESREERILKLQSMWKMSQIQKKFSLEKNQENDEITENMVKDAKDTILKLRRLKLQMERTNGIRARKRLFEEHTNINFEVESVEMEKMMEYFGLSEKERLALVPNNVQENVIKRLVYRYLGLIKGFL
jgi:hypothetical protein